MASDRGPRTSDFGLTRRAFLTRVARGGGSAYAAMVALGLLAEEGSAPSIGAHGGGAHGRAPLRGGSGKGTRVLILGAGLAGMAAAYELRRLGYEVQLLEARERAGGRAWTVRRGTEETEIGGERQRAEFDRGLYFNPGPARIPQQHRAVLDYCRELGVAVEVFTNVNEGAYYHAGPDGPLAGQAVRIRAAKADLRGHTAELLAKAVRRDALDQPLTGEDAERLIEYARAEGDLGADLSYRGSSRRGYTVPPGAGARPGEVGAPDALSALLRAGLGRYPSLEYDIFQQMTMLQIVGGTDRLAAAFERRVGRFIRFGAEVREIRRAGEGVRVVYADRTGAVRRADCDLCICTIPLSVLRDIPSDLSAGMQAAIRAVEYAPTVKIGLQFGRRFWEEDDQIFGGISRTGQSITQIWYPSAGYLSKKGILLGAYNFDGQALALGRLTPAEREAVALREGRVLHPQYDECFEASFSVAWQRVPYSLGGWASYSSEARQRAYPVLLRPDGPFYLAGEHLTYLTGWMAGAFESARAVVAAIHERVQRS